MDGIIFDIDGTLWDSRASVAAAWDAAIFETCGIEKHLTKEDMTPLFGRTTIDIERLLFEGDDLPQTLQDKAMAYALKKENEHLYEEPGILYEGVREMLKALSEKYPLFIVSNCDDGYIDALLDTTGLREYFKDYMCFSDTMQPKEVNLKIIAERNGITSPIYVGDTQGDLNSCKKAGIPMIHVTYGLGQADHPDYRADSPAEVAALCLEKR